MKFSFQDSNFRNYPFEKDKFRHAVGRIRHRVRADMSCKSSSRILKILCQYLDLLEPRVLLYQFPYQSLFLHSISRWKFTLLMMGWWGMGRNCGKYPKVRMDNIYRIFFPVSTLNGLELTNDICDIKGIERICTLKINTQIFNIDSNQHC